MSKLNNLAWTRVRIISTSDKHCPQWMACPDNGRLIYCIFKHLTAGRGSDDAITQELFIL